MLNDRTYRKTSNKRLASNKLRALNIPCDILHKTSL